MTAEVADTGAELSTARPDVFISYSRADGTFAESLLAALARRKLRAWIDKHDIPPSADWRETVLASIDAAGAVVFVLSPDFVSSPRCQEEVERALAGNKRVIPILRRAVASSEVGRELARLNWILLRDEDDFERGLEQLTEALTTDLVWREMHTRLALQAQEWSGSERDSSLLLRGSALSKAESMLSEQAEHQEAPTALQTEYVIASRRAALGRQRSLWLAAGLVLGIVSLLAVLAFIQRNEARTQRAAAERETARAQAQERLALARSVAADSSEALRKHQLDLALLLAAQAASYSPTIEARQALWGALRGASQVEFLAPRSAYPVGFADHGRLLLSALDGGGYISQDTADGHVVSRNRATRLLAASFDGTFLTQDKSGTVRIVEPPSKSSTRAPIAGGSIFDEFAIGPRGRMIAHASRDGAAVVLADRRRGTRITLAIPATPRPRIRSLHFTSDGHVLVVGAENTLLFDTRSGRPIGRLGPQYAFGIATDPADPDRVAITTFNGAALWSIRTRARIGKSFVRRADLTTAAFSGDGDVLAIGGYSGVVFWDLKTHRELPGSRSLGGSADWLVGGSGRSHFASSYEGSYSEGNDGGVAVWNLAGGNPLVRAIHAPIGIAQSVAFSSDGERLAAGGEDGAAIWNTRDLATALTYQAPATRSVAFSPSDDRLAISDSRGLQILSSTLNPLGGPMVFAEADEPSPAIAFSHDGRRVAAGYECKVLLWSIRSRTFSEPMIYGPPGSSGCGVTDLEFGPSGRVLAVTGIGGLAVWARGRLRGAPLRRAVDAGSWGLGFNSTGTRLVLADSLRIAVLDAAGLGTRVSGDVPDVLAVAYSPDGATIASQGYSTVALWNAGTIRLIGSLSRASTAPTGASVAYSPDGTRVAFAGGVDTVGLLDVDVDSWRRMACGIVNRGLTRGEWSKYVRAPPYVSKCPM